MAQNLPPSSPGAAAGAFSSSLTGSHPATRVPAARLCARMVGHELVEMDPRLQRARMRFAAGARKFSSASTPADEIAVIAKVRQLADWDAMSEVRPGRVIGSPDADGTVIVTGRIPLKRIEHVRKHPGVISLKPAQRVHPTLASTTAETRSRPQDLGFPATGKGVVVGIVDFGGDFAHRSFLEAAGKTRLLALWDQGKPGQGGGSATYGRVHRAAQINAALAKPKPYAALGYAPGIEAHGTHVMDIAAGNGRGTKTPGMAPGASLVFVELSASDVAWSGPDSSSSSFGDSVQLLEAISFIFDEAGDRPCVVNLSLGTNGGPHDGSSLVEQGIDRLVRARPNRAVVIAASNSQGDGIHAQGRVPAGGAVDLAFDTVASAMDETEDEMELWYAGASRLQATLLAPDGSTVCTVAPGQSIAIDDDAGQAVIGMVSSRLDDPNNHDNVISVWLGSSMPKGRWTLKLAADQATDFHAWIERNDPAQASFATYASATHQLGSISCGRESIVVGSYDAHKPSQPISWFSSAGPTRDNRQKPEVSAPGHAVIAAASQTGTGTTEMSGTSMAAPAVTGLVALVLSEAARRGVSLPSADIRSLVMNTARTQPPASAWNAVYGCGRICGKDALAMLATMHPIPVKKAIATRPARPARVPASLPVPAARRRAAGTRPRAH